MLHGFLDYRETCRKTRKRKRNFECGRRVSYTSSVEETNVPEKRVFASPQIADEPTPNDPPWNTWIAIVLWFLSVILIVLLPILFLAPYLVSSDMFARPADELAIFLTNDQTSVVLQMLAVIPAHLLTAIFGWLIVTNRGSFSFAKTLGFKSGGIRWWHHLLIFVGFAAFAILVSSFFPESENELTRILKSSRAAVIVVAIIATFSAPFVEELVYRGVLYSALQRSAGVPAAVAIVTIMFASVHAFQYYETPSILFLLTILSLILTLMRTISGNLLPCIIFHTIVNGVQSLGLVFEPQIRQWLEANPAFFFLIK